MFNRILSSEEGDCEITKKGREVRRKQRMMGECRSCLDIALIMGVARAYSCLRGFKAEDHEMYCNFGGKRNELQRFFEF